MKRVFSALLALVILAGVAGALPVSAANASTSITASKSTVAIGDTVSVTATFSAADGIGSIDAYFTYNAKTFEYVSCSGATANGGTGSIKMSYFSMDATPKKSVTISITLRATAVGKGKFEWRTEGVYDSNDNPLGASSKSLSVHATEPLSSDATLAYLSLSRGTLSPEFNPNVTRYTATVPHDVTQCVLNFGTTDSGATTAISGTAALKVGKNTRVITVTSEDGNTMKYTVVVTRQAQTTKKTTTTNKTTAGTKPGTTTQKTTKPTKGTEPTTPQPTEEPNTAPSRPILMEVATEQEDGSFLQKHGLALLLGLVAVGGLVLLAIKESRSKGDQ